MRTLRPSFIVMLSLAFVALVQAAYYYPQLPGRVASHFDASGKANGWLLRDGFVLFYLGLITLEVILFLGIDWALPHLPVSWINLPNRDYWLAAERRDRTILAVSTQILWMGCATLTLTIVLQQFVFQANLRPGQEMGAGAGISIGIYAGFMALWAIVFMLKFRRIRF